MNDSKMTLKWKEITNSRLYLENCRVDMLATSVEARKDADKSCGVDVKEDYPFCEDNCEIVNRKCACKMFLTAIDEKWLDKSKK